MACIVEGKVHIDLSGVDGNVFALLGLVEQMMDAAEAPAEFKAAFEDYCHELQDHRYEETLAMINDMFGSVIVWDNVPDVYRRVLELSTPCDTVAA